MLFFIIAISSSVASHKTLSSVSFSTKYSGNLPFIAGSKKELLKKSSANLAAAKSFLLSDLGYEGVKLSTIPIFPPSLLYPPFL